MFESFKKNKNTIDFAIILGLVTSIIIAFILIQGKGLYVDEGNHLDQILRFSHGNFSLDQILMTVPGFHFMIGGVAWALKITSISSIRTIVFSINCFSIIAFYVTRRMTGQPKVMNSLLEYIFIPIIFPYFFLIYTDITSLLFLILSLCFTLRKNYVLSGLFASLSMAIRQNNIIWLVFINIVLYFQLHGFHFTKKNIRDHVMRSYTFLIGALILGVYIILNKGIVPSDYAKSYVHISWSLLGNVYFALFVFSIVFLPICISKIPQIIRFISQRAWILPVIVVFYFIFMMTFKNDNPFNHSEWFIRNYLLDIFDSNTFMKTIFFGFGVWSVFTLIVSPLLYSWAYLLYPFTIVYLLPYWLIEQRYYFIPIVFFLLLSKQNTRRVERVQVLYGFTLSLVVFIGILNLNFFL